MTAIRAGWYDAPLTAAAHPTGTVVAAPSVLNGCWATSARASGKGGVKRARSCSLRARLGRLTCVAHRARERAARVLQAELASAHGDGR